jgi:outer membrane lipoprotein carrier protein
LLALAGSAWCQPADPNPPADSDLEGLAVLERFLTDVQSLTAEFTQELWTADQRLLETATGTLLLKRPNRFLWNYVEPIEQLVVADGEQLWMYDVELAQATVAPLEESAASSPAMLLSGDQAVSDGFHFVRNYVFDGLEWIELAPKLDGADFTSVSIGFKGEAPQRLSLVDGLNQVTRIDLTNVVVNPQLLDTAFEFEPPAGVDVIGGG